MNCGCWECGYEFQNIAHGPSPCTWGMLIVFGCGSYKVQIIYDGSSRLYIRIHSNSWDIWKKI